MRPARRSLTEFSMPASGAANAEPQRPAPVSPRIRRLHAVRPEAKPLPKLAAKPKPAAITRAPGARDGAAIRLPGPSLTTSAVKAEGNVPAPVGIAAEFCAKTIEVMTANVSATLDYARRLAAVNSPAEFVKLSASQTRKQIELVIAQTATMNALSRTLLASGTALMGNGAAKAGKKKITARH
jgi:hypothetical protein